MPREDAGLRSSAWGGDVGSPRRGPGHEGFSLHSLVTQGGLATKGTAGPTAAGKCGGGSVHLVRGAEGHDQGVGDEDCGPSTMTLG